MKEETKAIYELANAIDRLTLAIGHAVYLTTPTKTLEKREGYEEYLTGGFVDSFLANAMTDAENAIYDRDKKKQADGGHIADRVKEELAIDGIV